MTDEPATSSNAPKPSYVIVTPARDEEKSIEATIQSVQAQTLRPAEWILVNDGSSDATGDIIDRYAAEVPWMHAVHRVDRGFRQAGGGVVEAFYAGFQEARVRNWDYLVKLDADLRFEPTYFERCLAEFRADAKLGIAGGEIYNPAANGLELERHPRFHVRGATKIYSRACWEAIGGLVHAPGWDTIDEVEANRLGFTTRSFSDHTLVQLRFTGDAAGQWSNWVKNGRACHIAGYHPLFLMARSLSRLRTRPYHVAAIGMIWGFFGARLRRVERSASPETVAFMQREQLKRLFGRESMWR